MMNFLYALLGIINEMSPYILLGYFIAGLLHAFVPATAMNRHLSGHGIGPVVKAALFGIPLPLCSCGVLPTAVALRRGGASKGAATSFLIATPQTGVDSIAATYSLLGLPFAIIRPLAALVGAVFGGYAVDRFDKDMDSDQAIVDVPDSCEEHHGFWAKLRAAFAYGFIDMVASTGKWLTIGLVVAALITIFVPDSLFVSLSNYPFLAMIAVVVVAIPMYICATGSIPIAMSLMLKGLSPGIAFVMLMAGPAANFASIIILSRTSGRKATAIYVATVTITAIVFGLIIDLLLPSSWFALSAAPLDICRHHVAVLPAICSALLIVLLLVAPVLNRRFGHKHHHIINKEENSMENNTLTFEVEGMACPHCSKRVEDAAAAVDGVVTAKVDLSAATLTITGKPNSEKIIEAVTRVGYDIKAK